MADLTAPSEGDWSLLVWLEDAAGNADPSTAAVVGGVGLDESPPELTIARPDEDDPARVRVVASDDVSGIAAGQIEARRRGEDAWRALPTVLDAQGFSAVMDDERLPTGTYELRARAVDEAGNERSTRLAGRRRRASASCRSEFEHDSSSASRRAFARAGPTAASATARSRRQATSELRPHDSAPRAAHDSGRQPARETRRSRCRNGSSCLRRSGGGSRSCGRAALADSDSRRSAGRAEPCASDIPARAKIRARSTEVDLGVRARTTIKASRHRVVNGEEVTFSGRLKGRQYGSVGKTLYLQVYTRGRWATFATPRANSASGRWREDYRFTATRGLVRYRFRAVVPREAGYPYERGASRTVRVTVRGL